MSISIYVVWLFISYLNVLKLNLENYHSYRDDQWTKDAIDKKIQFVLENDWIGVEGAYTFEETQIVYEMVEKFKDNVIGNQVLVVGSETPWVEAIVLAVGAKNVTTMEYNKIVSTHPQVKSKPIDILSFVFDILL